MATSTHRVDVVPVHLEPHPNADSLSIVRVFGFTVCVRTADWQTVRVVCDDTNNTPEMLAAGQLAAQVHLHMGPRLGAYIQPDSLVDTARPEFAFLAQPGRTRERIRVRRLRGVISMGLLLPAPDGAKAGDDVAALLGVERYEPPVQSSGGEAAPAPPGYRPVYDVESWRRYGGVLVPGEAVHVTEKIHGANARYAYADGQFHAGSRTEWKARGGNIWWQAAEANPSIERFCRANPGATLYGEVYGQVQDLTYGVPKGAPPRFVAFDVLSRGGEWIYAELARAMCVTADVPFVPELFAGPYDHAAVEQFAEGPSVMPGADHVREGCVVRPVKERTDPEAGRVVLKIVGNGYLERA